jgi:hypothetical protein
MHQFKTNSFCVVQKSENSQSLFAVTVSIENTNKDLDKTQFKALVKLFCIGATSHYKCKQFSFVNVIGSSTS